MEMSFNRYTASTVNDLSISVELIIKLGQTPCFFFQTSHRVSRTPTYPTKQYLPLRVYFLTRSMCSECCATQ